MPDMQPAPAQPEAPKKESPKPSMGLWDQLDDFGSEQPPAKPTPPRFASPSADFDFGNRENNGDGDDFDLLGDLGKLL